MANLFDGENLIITLEAVVNGALTVDILDNLYEDAKDWYRANQDNRKYPFPFVSDGGKPLTSIIDQGAYIFLANDVGWRIRPFENDGTYYFIGNLAPNDETLPILTPTVGDFSVLIDGLQPVTQGVIPEMKDNLRFAVYQNAAWVNQLSSNTGTEFPVGSPRAPVNNIADAIIVAQANGFQELDFTNGYTFLASDNVDGYSLRGRGGSATTLLFAAGASTDGCRFYDAEIKGDLTGAIYCENCHVETTVDIGSTTEETEFYNCLMEPGKAVTVAASATEELHFRRCDSGSAGDIPVEYDWNGASAGGTFRQYAGGILLSNLTGGNEISIDGDVHLTIAASCTNATIVTRGDVKITNLASGNPNLLVFDQGTFQKLLLLWRARGLDPDNPAVINEDGSVDSLDINIDGNTVGTTPNRVTTLTQQ